MIALNNLFYGLFAVGLLSYFSTKIKRSLGYALSSLTITAVLLVFIIGGEGVFNGSTGIVSFEMSSLGMFFCTVVLLAYSMVSFFNPFWMNRIAYPAAYNMLYVFSLTGIIGVFLSADFITFFVYWEVAVWASVMAISFGKSGRAATSYFALSTFGSFAMLYGIFLLHGIHDTFEIGIALSSVMKGEGASLAAFLLIMLGALVKLGIFPFHVALPGALVDAPDNFSPLLSGGIEKMGAFIAILLVAAFPAYQVFEGQFSIFGVPAMIYTLMLLSGLTIIIGTLMAIKQDDMKRLFAYSSMANGGYMLLAILLNNRMSLSGALVHVFAHAVASVSAYLVIAAVKYRTGTTKMTELGGLAHRMPVTFSAYMVSILTMIGVPPTIGFLPKWLLFQTLASKGLFILSGVAFFGSIGSILYTYKPMSTVFLGQLSPRHYELSEVPKMMLLPMVILSGVSLYFGVFSKGLIDYTARIEKSLGFENTIETAGNTIIGSNGNMNSILITGVFAIGLVISAIVFFTGKKSRKVDLLDTYTAGEFIYTPELYHYNYGYAMTLERLYENHPETARMYEGLVARIRDFGKLVKALVYNRLASQGVLLAVIVMIFLIWGERL